MGVELRPREGKVLRYVVSHGEPVTPGMCVVKIEWSDLPHTVLSALYTLEQLRGHGLVEATQVPTGRRTPARWAYASTPAGKKLISRADKQGLWRV